MIQLGGFTLPRLPHPVVHLPHLVDHLIRSLPLGQELAFSKFTPVALWMGRASG